MADSSNPKLLPRVRSMEFIECDQMLEMVRGGSGEFIQVGKGRCLGSMRQINLDGIEMLCAELSNTTIVRAAAHPNIEVVHLPIRWRDEMRWNGRQIRRPTGLVWGKDAEWSRVASDSCVVTIGIDRDTLLSGLATWTGRDPHESWRFDGHILNPTDQTRNLLTRVSEVVELSERSPEVFELPELAKGIRDSLLSSLLSATLADVDVPSETVSLDRRSRAVVKAGDFLRQQDDRDVSLLDLCGAAEVSARTLEYAFKENLGISPMQYLRLRRLKRARVLLRRGCPSETSVTACALSAGFTHMGRFSVAYREFFGESASTTLGRSNG